MTNKDSRSGASVRENLASDANGGAAASGSRKSAAARLDLKSLSRSEMLCLHAICQRGSVVLAMRGGATVGLSAGEWLPFHASTYLRLVGRGLIEFQDPLRMVPSDGVAAAIDPPPARLHAALAEMEPA